MSKQPPEENRCQHTDAVGRRCRMPRADGHLSLCPTHVGQAVLKFQSKQNLASELLGPIEDFQTAAAINHALGRIYVLLAGNRINTRQAAVLAYVCQLMLQTLSEVKHEVGNALDSEYRESELFRIIDSLPVLDPKLATSKSGSHSS